MIEIEQRIKMLRSDLPPDVKLVAVSKTKPLEDIKAAYNCGQRIFGENKIQELTYKSECLPEDIQWHMIGHLQTNKVKYIASFIKLIHSVDSIKLLKTINKEASKHKRVIDCLLQVKINEEESKFGLSKENLEDLLSLEELHQLTSVRIVGLMGMATYTSDNDKIKLEFRTLKDIFEEIKTKYFQNKTDFAEISMGMSDDFRIAVEEGSTMVRVGSGIFGKRSYKLLK